MAPNPDDGSGSPLGPEEALDIIEGITAGGVVSVGTYVIGGAVSLLPGTFLAAAAVTPLAAITGALTFVGIAVHQIRKRNGW